MITLILQLAIVGFIVYLIANYIKMPDVFKITIYVIVAICLILYLMRVFNIADIPIPHF